MDITFKTVSLLQVRRPTAEMAKYEIENLEELISQYVGSDKIISDVQIRPLLAPGENYFSNMLEVNLKLKNKINGAEEPFHAVAKCMLGSNPGMPGPMTYTYLSEVTFYKEIVPVIEKFLRNEGAKGIMEIVPKLYAVRPNLHGKNDEVDGHAVILLENLKTSGKIF